MQEEDAQTTDDADPSLNYIDGWSHATNSPGAFDGTLSTSTERTLVTWNGGVSDKSVAVIGPKGPGLGTMNIAAFGDGANTKVVAVDLSAPTRLDQQVLFEFSAPGGNIALQITADWNNTIAIDAIKHGAQVESKWTFPRDGARGWGGPGLRRDHPRHLGVGPDGEHRRHGR